MSYRRIVPLALLLSALAGPAFAHSCPTHMKAIDEALAKNPPLSAAQMTEVKELRAQGEVLHKAGKHDESIMTLGKAEAILGLKR
jgi:hypothetical protein